MIKRRIMFIFTMLITILSACQTTISEEEKILTQYQSFLAEDIADDVYFDTLINEMTHQTIPGFLQITHTINTMDGTLLDEKIGAGIIYKVFDDKVYLVTPSTLITNEIPESMSTIKVYDYLNRPYSASVIDTSLTYGLTILEFRVNVEIAKLRKMTVSDYSPLIYEPVMMISHYNQIHNSMMMGFVEQKSEDNQTMFVTLPGDDYILGGAILNMRNELVGIVIDYIDGQAVIYDIQFIRLYLE